MLWSQNWIKPQFGYSRMMGLQRDISRVIMNSRGNPKSYKFHDVVGNTQYKGRWSWKLAENVDNNAAKCYEWYASQPSTRLTSRIENHRRSDCPCSRDVARLDRRYRFWRFLSSLVCYAQRPTWTFIGTSVSYHTVCCYDEEDGSLINELDPDFGPATQKYITTKYRWDAVLFSGRLRRESRRTAVEDDAVAFGYCCQKSSLCDRYLEKRPVPNCSGYRRPRRCKYLEM